MGYEMQAKLVREIAGLFDQYRNDDPSLVKFGLKCGLALNKLPIAGGVMMSPKTRQERFNISDPAFREKYPTEKEAFLAAFDAFVGHAQFLAWNGKAPSDGKFELVREMSDDFTRPTMQIEVIYRRRGQDHEEKLSMLFVGFQSDQDAKGYAASHAAQVA